MTSDWFGRGFGSSVSVAKRRLNLFVGSALHDAGEFAVVEFATSGFNLVEHLGNLGLGESVGLDTTVAEETLDGIDGHLAGSRGVGSGHLLAEKLEEHLEVEGAWGLGDHGSESG